MTAVPRPVGPVAEAAPVAPSAAPAQDRPRVRATGARPELDPHERVSEGFARLAVVFGEAAQICEELAQVELAAGAGSALMVTVPEASKTRPLLTVKDVAELLHVDEKTVRRWREEKKLPPALAVGGIVRWDGDEIDDWIAHNREAEP